MITVGERHDQPMKRLIFQAVTAIIDAQLHGLHHEISSATSCMLSSPRMFRALCSHPGSA